MTLYKGFWAFGSVSGQTVVFGQSPTDLVVQAIIPIGRRVTLPEGFPFYHVRIVGPGEVVNELNFGFALNVNNEQESNDTPNSATLATVFSTIAGSLTSPTDRDFFRFPLERSGQLRITAVPLLEARGTTLTLLDAQGRTLVDSTAVSLLTRNPMIEQYLIAGDYFLKVSRPNPTTAVVPYQFQLDFRPTSLTGRTALDGFPDVEARFDLNDDGNLDNFSRVSGGGVGVFMGNGDGTFRDAVVSARGTTFDAVRLADIDLDGRIDVIGRVNINGLLNGLAVLLGNGDGTFRDPLRTAQGVELGPLQLFDLDDDEDLDIVAPSFLNDEIKVFLGRGDGTFSDGESLNNGGHPLVRAEVIDLDGDSWLDVVAVQADLFDESIVFYRGHGNGEFDPSPIALFTSPDGTRFQLIDLNGDDRVDLLAPGGAFFEPAITVLLGQPDGLFGAPQTSAAGFDVDSVELIDLDHDGLLDIVSGRSLSQIEPPDTAISVLFGNADGTFGEPFVTELDIRIGPLQVVDVDEDGQFDLLTPVDFSTSGGGIAVLRGDGSGNFEAPQIAGAGTLVRSIQLIDLNGDDILDAVTRTDVFGGGIGILLGTGNGQFGTITPVGRGRSFGPIQIFDLNRDGRRDIVTSPSGLSSAGYVALVGNGDGTFGEPTSAFDSQETQILDINADGRLDMVGRISSSSGGIGLRLGNGDGTFREPIIAGTGFDYRLIRVIDLDGDGRLDLVANTTAFAGSLAVFLGNGDGTFREPNVTLRGVNPFRYELIDLNRDNELDLFVTAFFTIGVSTELIFLGNGDGTFRDPPRPERRDGFSSSLFVDLDGDLDLDRISSIPLGEPTQFGVPLGLGVLMANGEGTFEEPLTLAAFSLQSTQLIDLDGDTDLDLIGSGSVFGSGGGIFALFRDDLGRFGPPMRLVEGGFNDFRLLDFDSDGQADLLAQFLFGSDNMLFLKGNGDGTFESPVTIPAVSNLGLLIDVNGDGRIDVPSVASGLNGGASVRYGNGTPEGGETVRFGQGLSLLAGRFIDLNGDDRLDNVSPILNIGTFVGGVAVFLAQADGSFGEATLFGSESLPVLQFFDFDGDGNLDLTGNTLGEAVLLGNGEGAFGSSVRRETIPRRPTPHRDDLDRDGIADLVIVNSLGEVQFRRGLPGANNLYDPPVVINIASSATGSTLRPAVDGVLFHATGGASLAISEPLGGVAIYALIDGSFSRSIIGGVTSGLVRLYAADLNGDGLDDLVGIDRNRQLLTVLFQGPTGQFDAPLELPLGVGTNDVTFADLDGVNGTDIVAVNRSSGDVNVFFNDPSHTFANSSVYRAGTSVSSLSRNGSRIAPVSTEEPIGVAGGDFTGDGRLDLLILERGARRLRVLAGIAGGGFTNPSEAMSSPLGDGVPRTSLPAQIRSADFDRDGKLDAVVLGEQVGQLLVYRGNGNGTFAFLPESPEAGNAPTGMNLAQVNDDNGDGQINSLDFEDVLIGNGFGDVLTLLGNGDGTFRSFVRADQRVPFATGDLDGDGTFDVVLAQQAIDTASSTLRTPGTVSFTPGAFQTDGSDGLIGPGDVELADLDGRFGTDLIFANTGSNNVLVYLRRADGSFDQQPLSFFAGTSPADIQVAELNGDGAPDLVIANQGSNDVSILFGARGVDSNTDGRIDDQDLFRLGPRLDSGGRGTSGVTTMDVNGDRIPDIVATNSTSGTVTVLPGVGSGGVGTGSFVDAAPRTVDFGTPVQEVRLTPSGQGFALTVGGAIRAFDPTSGALGVTFTPPVGRDIGTFQVASGANGASLLFTLNRDGTGSVLNFTTAGFAEIRSFQTGAFNPSDLQVFTLGGGQFEIYLTDSILGLTPVVQLSLADVSPVPARILPIPTPTPTIPFIPVPDVVGGLQPVDNDNPFVLVATLVTAFNESRPLASGSGEEAAVANPFETGDAGSLDLDEVVVSEDGTILTAGALALISLEFEGEDEQPVEEVVQEETLEQYINGLRKELNQWLRGELNHDPLPVLPVLPLRVEAVGAEVQPANEAFGLVDVAAADSTGVAAASNELSDDDRFASTEAVSLEAASTEFSWDAFAGSLVGALILSGAYVGGYLPGNRGGTRRPVLSTRP